MSFDYSFARRGLLRSCAVRASARGAAAPGAGAFRSRAYCLLVVAAVAASGCGVLDASRPDLFPDELPAEGGCAAGAGCPGAELDGTGDGSQSDESQGDVSGPVEGPRPDGTPSEAPAFEPGLDGVPVGNEPAGGVVVDASPEADGDASPEDDGDASPEGGVGDDPAPDAGIPEDPPRPPPPPRDGAPDAGVGGGRPPPPRPPPR